VAGFTPKSAAACFADSGRVDGAADDDEADDDVDVVDSEGEGEGAGAAARGRRFITQC
jgi:hypothetical protein